MDVAPRSPVVLVVDDEPNIRELLFDALELNGFRVRTAATGTQALASVGRERPDLILLDVMLPDLDGFAVAQRLRQDGGGPPVLFLTARDTVADRIAGLSAGGDDYVTKPFSLEEVVLRIRAILRRTGPREEACDDGLLRYADLEMDEETHVVRRAGRRVHLSPTEFGLLRYLMINAERVISKSQILDRVWDHGFGTDSRIVESYISYLRRKIDAEGPPLIHTLRGVGYSLRDQSLMDRRR
jgi:two-component system, OmpR family, response regulator